MVKGLCEEDFQNAGGKEKKYVKDEFIKFIENVINEWSGIAEVRFYKWNIDIRHQGLVTLNMFLITLTITD